MSPEDVHRKRVFFELMIALNEMPGIEPWAAYPVGTMNDLACNHTCSNRAVCSFTLGKYPMLYN